MKNDKISDHLVGDHISLQKEGNDNYQQLIFMFLSALVVFAPIPLGSNRPVAWDMLALAVAGLLVAGLFFRRPTEEKFEKELTVPVALFFLVIFISFVQMSSATPAAWHNPIWRQTADAFDQPVKGAIAVDRQSGLQDILRLTSYAGVFLLSAFLCRKSSRARAAILIVTVASSMYAVYGLVVYWSGNATILWMPKWAYQNALTATFVNRNSAATYFGVCTLAVLCQVNFSFESLHLYGDRREKLAILIEFASRRTWLLLCLFVVITACVLTHSRAGLASTFVGWVAFIFIRTHTMRKKRSRNFVALAVALGFATIAVAVSGQRTFDRMVELSLVDNDQGGRFQVYGIILQMISDHPLLGVGIGSFAPAFEIYRPSSVVPYYDLAHNDYLQNILELGIPAALCLFVAVGWLIGLCVRGCWVKRSSAAFSCLAVAASVLVALHATLDFSLQIPAITVTYMYLLGVGVAQSRSPRQHPD